MQDNEHNPYILLTPGPLSTSIGVRKTMMRDWCTWDEDYNLGVVQKIRSKLTALATDKQHDDYTAVLMQGSGTASVEALLGTVIAPSDKVLIINNGAYGARMEEIARYLNLNHTVITLNETASPSPDMIDQCLVKDQAITHVAMVHCETTTGMLNPIESIAAVVNHHKKEFIVDAMSSFGGIALDMRQLNINYLISSANKCIQGVPGFGFVIAKKTALAQCAGQARSLSLDLYAQWTCMEENQGKWRFTSPTHTVRAFYKALEELEAEGGIQARYQRYKNNQCNLVHGMQESGFQCLLPKALHSPFITAFRSPINSNYEFKLFYQHLKEKGFVIYPGKVSHANCFRIGNIGEVYSQDIANLLKIIPECMYWL